MKYSFFSDSRIVGSVEAEVGHTLLFTSIPYDANWHVFVDGHESGTLAVMDGAFLAVPMDIGKHDVVFEYKNPWKYRGIVLSVIGMIAIIFISIAERRKASQKV